MACSFRSNIIIVILAYTTVAALFGVGVVVTCIQRSKYIKKYYNTTLITITGYKIIPGICITCPVIPPVPPAKREQNYSDPSDCYTRPGYYAYATISYDVWAVSTNNFVKYQGETPNNEWCDSGPGSAVQHAESEYGDIGSVYSGYYLLKTPTDWHWYIPGHRHYVNFITMLSICIIVAFTAMICHIAILCRSKRLYGYKSLQ